jgi:hypothetical protein
MEGAPGHQAKQQDLGAYRGAVKPLDRWDPVVAAVGGVWDQLVAPDGAPFWGTAASSDFHDTGMGDYWPCQFSETWVYAPERSVGGVLTAVRAGSFAGVHGRIVSQPRLVVSAPGLVRPAIPGEAIVAAPGTTLTVALSAAVQPQDWEGAANRLDRLEIIGVDRTGARVVGSAADSSSGRMEAMVVVPADGLVLRARGCRSTAGPALCFYTNPIRVSTKKQA